MTAPEFFTALSRAFCADPEAWPAVLKLRSPDGACPICFVGRYLGVVPESAKLAFPSAAVALQLSARDADLIAAAADGLWWRFPGVPKYRKALVRALSKARTPVTV